MADETGNTVTITMKRDYEFTIRFDSIPAAAELLADEPPPLGGAKGPNPSALLVAAVANCLAASLAFCLRRSRVEVKGLQAVARARIGRNEAGRLRVAGIDVDVRPELEPGDIDRLDRCKALFEDFCVVSSAVRNGVPVGVTVSPVVTP